MQDVELLKSLKIKTKAEKKGLRDQDQKNNFPGIAGFFKYRFGINVLSGYDVTSGPWDRIPEGRMNLFVPVIILCDRVMLNRLTDLKNYCQGDLRSIQPSIWADGTSRA